ncbi:MAG: PVC-type heme-binding CxxCH protein, partial [Planctomycetia bacterium]
MAACLAAFAFVADASPPVAPTEALSPEVERAKFKLPPGVAIQRVAGEPEIQKPMNLAFATRGRLWVTHSVEYPYAAAAGTTPRDGLTVLEDFGPDGRARKATRFADGLNIPIGVLPLPNAAADGRGQEVIVWSIPNIWKLTDSDGDGKADRREVLYGPFDFADTHGNQNAFRLGPDGWVYACHGYRNASKVKLRGEGEVVLEMTSGNTYRFRPDGSAIEQVSWGQVNPFGMCFDRLGNQFTADCHSKPIMMILRGGYYDSFGQPHDGLGYAPLTTGDGHGSTGIAGMAAYEAEQFPADYRGSMFVGNVMTNIIHRDVPEWRGSSPWVEKPTDFVSCDDWWFRPVDLQLGPDGGLYVADFYNCIIGHYEVDLKHPRRDRHRGRIWRIVWQGADGQAAAGSPADLTKLGDEKLVALLGDSNATVRRLAFDTLMARAATPAGVGIAELFEGVLAVSPTAETPHGDDRRSLAVRGLARLGRLSGDSLALAAKDPAAVVRVHLVKALAT